MTTVLDALRAAQINFESALKTGSKPIFMIAQEQLSNAVMALENGMSANDVIQDEMFGDVKRGAE